MNILRSELHAPLDLPRLEALFDDEVAFRVAVPRARWPFDRWEWNEWLCSSGVNSYFVTLGGKTVGHFGLKTLIPERRHISWIYLNPAVRGGRGREFLALAEQIVRSQGVTCVTLNAMRTCPASLHLYETYGYEHAEESSQLIFMRKELI